MRILGVTGGIGSGKTAVTDYLASRGVTVVDADVVAREVVEPGSPAWQALVDAFGRAILLDDDAIDRPFLAHLAFGNAAALRRLNRITHTAIGVRIAELISSSDLNEAVAVALPLFRTEHRMVFGLESVWSIEVDADIAIERLVLHRSFERGDAQARVAAQMTNAQRAVIVDRVIPNDADLATLLARVDEAFAEFRGDSA